MIEQIDRTRPVPEGLLSSLDDLHRLRDIVFDVSSRTAGPGSIRLVALRGGIAQGYLEGTPASGHIVVFGVLRQRRGVGSRLVTAFIERARIAGADAVSVVLDTDPRGRWGRRQFVEHLGFRAAPGSALHFSYPL